MWILLSVIYNLHNLFFLQTDLFKIDSDTGVITLAKALDFETEKKHTLVVIARVRVTNRCFFSL